MAYSEKVIDHYENPRNVGKMEIDETVGTGMVGAPACGDVMKLQIKVEETRLAQLRMLRLQWNSHSRRLKSIVVSLRKMLLRQL